MPCKTSAEKKPLHDILVQRRRWSHLRGTTLLAASCSPLCQKPAHLPRQGHRIPPQACASSDCHITVTTGGMYLPDQAAASLRMALPSPNSSGLSRVPCAAHRGDSSDFPVCVAPSRSSLICFIRKYVLILAFMIQLIVSSYNSLSEMATEFLLEYQVSFEIYSDSVKSMQMIRPSGCPTAPNRCAIAGGRAAMGHKPFLPNTSSGPRRRGGRYTPWLTVFCREDPTEKEEVPPWRSPPLSSLSSRQLVLRCPLSDLTALPRRCGRPSGA